MGRHDRPVRGQRDVLTRLRHRDISRKSTPTPHCDGGGLFCGLDSFQHHVAADASGASCVCPERAAHQSRRSVPGLSPSRVPMTYHPRHVRIMLTARRPLSGVVHVNRLMGSRLRERPGTDLLLSLVAQSCLDLAIRGLKGRRKQPRRREPRRPTAWAHAPRRSQGGTGPPLAIHSPLPVPGHWI